MEHNSKNMLIIGNGFDLAHERPTRYSDFLSFAEYIMLTKDSEKDKNQFQKELMNIHPDVKSYILRAFDDRVISQVPGLVSNNNEIIREIYECLDKNVWYEYFLWIRANDLARGKDWVDFEAEILEVVSFFDRQITNIYDPISAPHDDSTNEKILLFWTLFCAKIKQEKAEKCVWANFVDKTFQDLQDLVRCLELYLDDCVTKMPVTHYSPDIKKLKIYSVLSFNYTAIPTDIYLSLTNTHYIHGHADSNRPATENDMVLGVNEYWNGYEKDSRTNFNCYKKFVQRIIKETGIGYKKVLDQMRSEYEEFEQSRTIINGNIEPKYNNVFIFGHSLDVTDGDILREVIRTPGVITTIYYRDKQQQASQIANLSKVLRQDELLERVFSTSPTIIFKQQAKMMPR